jgi:hypothetical protein
MILRDFDAITKAEIDSLVTNAVAERRTIEYKQQLPGNGDEDKKEFLADVSSFANAAGGDIIYGITEQRDENGKPMGIPEKAEGLAGVNADAEKLRLEEIVRAGIDPRVPGLRVGHYDGFPSGPVIVIRVHKSWASPHMVIFKNLSRFFTRNSAGKQQLDVREIRAAFTASGDLHTRISDFHTERLGKIIANEGPVVLPDTPKVILHLIPFTILDPATQIDLTPLDQNPAQVPPIRATGWNHRFNLDGFLTYSQYRLDQPADSYVQVFRSGIFEAVATGLMIQREGNLLIPAPALEGKLLESLRKYLAVAKALGVSTPLVIMLSFHGVRGYRIWFHSHWYDYGQMHAIDRDTLLLPDVLLENFSTSADVALKPIFDALWQAGGMAGCQHYNEKGRWNVVTNY